MGDKHVIYRSQFERQRDEGMMIMQDWAIENIYPLLVMLFKGYLIGIPISFVLFLVVGSYINKGFVGIKNPIGYALAWPIMIFGLIGQSKILRKVWSGK